METNQAHPGESQLSIFDPPAARTTDPDTSHEADERNKGGDRDRQCALVLAALEKTPNTTSRELAEYHGLDRHLCGRRLSTLEHRRKVIKGEKRACRFAGTNAYTWRPV